MLGRFILVILIIPAIIAAIILTVVLSISSIIAYPVLYIVKGINTDDYSNMLLKVNGMPITFTLYILERIKNESSVSKYTRW